MKRRPKRPPVEPQLQAIFDAANAMTLSGQEPRKHHVVPRFYLERWAEADRVLVTDLDTKDSHRLAAKNALIETDFYRVPAGTAVGSDSPVVWEAWLSTVEGESAAAFDKFDRVGFRGLDGDDFGKLAMFVAVQSTRSRYHRYQGRWMWSRGVYESFELDKPGAIEHHMRQAGEDPTPEQVAEAEAYWARVIEDPWQMNVSAVWEMDMAMRTAGEMSDMLATRKASIYETEAPLLTSDEPVVTLHEQMGADHVIDGGFFGTPIIVFPLDPHHVLALFRENMPVLRPVETALDWRESLDLNRVIAGNAYRHVVAQPSNEIGGQLYVPASKPPTQILRASTDDGQELIRWRQIRRWSDEADAPVRPVPAWWPLVLPPAPRPPSTEREERAEYAKWAARGPKWTYP